jgi:hypothetical protein
MIFGSQHLVFVNSFCSSSCLCTLKISLPDIELGFDDIFGTRGTQFLSTVSQSAVVFVNCFSASSSLCTLKISASAVELHFKDDFWDTRDSVFVNGLSVRSSLFAQKMSASVVEQGF